jgi:phosphoribosylanthranilate isomerase
LIASGMTLEVKICGLRDPLAVDAAVQGGARLVGFVFFPASPRDIRPVDAAALAARVPAGVTRVGLVVDANDAMLTDLLAQVPLDVLQLHGSETPERVAAIRAHCCRPVIKSIPVAEATDLSVVPGYAEVADRLLFDARAPVGASRPGGNSRAFDWRLLAGRRWARPWILAGGLDAGNLADAVRLSGAAAVDVSSGVEDAPGRKSVARIRAFLAAAAEIAPSPCAAEG